MNDKRELRAIALEVRNREDRINQLEDRIKRLEYAGDELLRDNDDMANINRWLRAKEAKP